MRSISHQLVYVRLQLHLHNMLNIWNNTFTEQYINIFCKEKKKKSVKVKTESKFPSMTGKAWRNQQKPPPGERYGAFGEGAEECHEDDPRAPA